MNKLYKNQMTMPQDVQVNYGVSFNDPFKSMREKKAKDKLFKEKQLKAKREAEEKASVIPKRG